MKRLLKSMWRERKGFTLVELLLFQFFLALATAAAAADWEEVWRIIQEIIQFLGG